MLQKTLPTLSLCVGLLTAAGCKDTSPPAWGSGAALNTERTEKSYDVALSWPAATDDEAVTGYELVRDQGPPLALAPGQTVHTCEKLTDAAEHTFSLRARDAAGNWSTPLTARLSIPDITPPTWPVARFDWAEGAEPGASKAILDFRWEPAADNVGISAYVLTRKGSDFRVELGPEAREHRVEGKEISGTYLLEAKDAAGNTSPPLRCTADTVLGNKGLLAMLGSGGPQGLNTIMGGTGMGGDLESAIGNLRGIQVGGNTSFGGLGSSGSGGVDLGSGLSGLNHPPEKVPGSVAPSVASTTGGIDASAFRRAIASRRGAFKACYEKRLKQDPTIKGSLELTLTLKDGQITQTEITGGSLEDSGTRSCVRRVFRRIRLPGADGIVVTKFVFQKA